MASTVIRPIGHEDRLSVIDHLDELRTRLIVSAVALVVAFSLAFAFNHALLDVLTKPLKATTEQRTKEGKGPLGEIYVGQRAAHYGLAADVATLRALARDPGLSAATRRSLAAQLPQAERALAQVPLKPPENSPVTLGVGEPFLTTMTVALYFALLFAGPIVLLQLYGFLLPAFTPKERRVALPLMTMIPVLFFAGVTFGYFVVLPAATRFLQNFNADQFNVLVQANQYYKFAALTLLAMGLVFQLPVGILALTRLGVIDVRWLNKNRRYAYLVLAVIAAALPGTDPVSMLIELIPLLVLYELSVVMARFFGKPVEGADDEDHRDDDDDEPDFAPEPPPRAPDSEHALL